MRSLGLNEILFILAAVRWTLLLSACAFVGGSVGGILIALMRSGRIKALRWFAFGYIKLFQGTPLLMQLVLAFFVPGIFGIDVNPWGAAAIGLSLHASAFLGEIWKGCVDAVPRTQREAAECLALTRWQAFVDVILPQAARIATPPTVGFMVQLVKNTSLASIIGFQELTHAAQYVNNLTLKPVLVYGLVGAMYFAVCFPLYLLSRRLEAKFHVHR